MKEHFTRVPTKKGCLCDDDTLADTAEKRAYETLWNEFGPIYCICLITRKDRFEAACAQFHQYGLCRLAQFLMVNPPTQQECRAAGVISKGRFGIWNSHETITKAGFADPDVKSVMGWEDDFLFRHKLMSVQRLQQVVDDWKAEVVPRHYDIFKLGQHTRSGKAIRCGLKNTETKDPSFHNQFMSRIFKSQSVLLHCYVWSRKGAEQLWATSFANNKLDNGGEEEEDIDSWMIRKGLAMYNCYPQLVVQSGSLSSNTGNDKNAFYDRIERVYWPMFGSYCQRTFCNELDWIALYGVEMLPIILLVVVCSIAVMFLVVKTYCITATTKTTETNTNVETTTGTDKKNEQQQNRL